MVTPGEPATIKLHSNRRLCQPGAARYVTLSELQTRMRDGIAAIVREAKTGADVTDLVLTPRPTEH